jgi:two-component system, sensor histidine kinase
MRKLWQNQSVSKKLYIVVGVMGLLVASELFTLLFAMNTLSAVRAFVGGEGLWSKAQKDAVISLQKFARTGDENNYEEFLRYVQVPLGDRKARIELEKPNPDRTAIYEGFTQGRIHHDDIDGLIKLVRQFYPIKYLADALDLWSQADLLLSEIITAAENLRFAVQTKDQFLINERLARIDALNEQLTAIEDQFSFILGKGSRWLERILILALLFAVLTIEATGLLLTVSFSKTLTRGLFELNYAALKVREGDFSHKVNIDSGDELGQLAKSLNSMNEALAKNIGQRRQAEADSETKSQFLANMSHEIRTPVGTIVSYSEFLKEPDLDENERKKFVEVIHQTGMSLTRLINDILDLSKVEAGHFEIDNISFSLSSLLKEVQVMLEPKCEEKSIELKIQRQGYVPDLIYSDPLRLKQILLNIIGNAIKFTDHGQVCLKYRSSDGALFLEVKDTGIGISEGDSAHLFQVFSQVDGSSTRKHAGTGLGLVLSRRLARLLDGDVFLAESEPGFGSTFMIVVGLKEPPAVQARTRRRRSSTNKESLSGRSALVVDDSEDNRFLLERILKKHGMNVSVAKNGLEGSQKALSNDFDIILMDIQMPVMDGYTAAKELRSKGLNKPIVALTAHAMKEDQNRCIRAGCNGYLTKPVQVQSLINTLIEYLDTEEEAA